MAARGSFEGLLEQLYASGADARGMSRFLNALREPFNAHITAFHFHDYQHREHDFHHAIGISADEVTSNAQRIAGGRHLWFERGQRILEAAGVCDSRELASDRELEGTSFYRDFLTFMDIHDGLALGLHSGADGQMAAISINRDHRRGHFKPSDMRLAKRLLPHVRNVYALQQRLSWIETLLGGFRAALDRLQTGAVLLDRHNRIVFSNQEAKRLCAERNGLTERSGRLSALWPPDRKPLEQLIECATAGLLSIQPETMLLRGPHGQPAATVTALPVPHATTVAWSESAVVAVVFARPIRPRKPSADALRKIFDLTKAEATLAESLAEGKTLAQAAVSAEKSMATVRTQLRALLAKTGTHRQAALVQLLIATVANLTGV